MIAAGFVASLLAGLATGVGALRVLFLRGNISHRLLDGMLGLAAGVMLAATAFSLGARLVARGRDGSPGPQLPAAGGA